MPAWQVPGWAPAVVHGVPFKTVPVSVHTGAPVSQTIAAIVQVGSVADVQAAPAAQTHAPVASQTWPMPHELPVGSRPDSAQTGVPLLQEEVVPLRQTIPGSHAAPTVHTHAPVAHASPDPQEVPSSTLPVSVQTGAPVSQVIAAILQRGSVVDVQAVPAAHCTQPPVPLQTRPLPHDVPGVTRPASVQTGVPVPQEVVPPWQTIPGSHASPAAHGTQPPVLLQTRPVPQDVPGVTGPASVQTAVPVLQDVVPPWQTIPGSHVAPAAHVTQAPALQT